MTEKPVVKSSEQIITTRDLDTEIIRAETGAPVISTSEAIRAADNILNVSTQGSQNDVTRAVQNLVTARQVGVIGRNVANAGLEKLGQSIGVKDKTKKT